MGSIGTPELIVIGVLALLVFGPKRLPEIGKNVGAAIREFRRASRDLMSHFHDDDPPRVRSFGRNNDDADSYAPPDAVATQDDWNTDPTSDAAQTVDIHPVTAPVSGQNGDHSSLATSAPEHDGEAVAATTSTAAHHAVPAESERNA
jgi:TatA/E family protein of Tat protein translocase